MSAKSKAKKRKDANILLTNDEIAERMHEASKATENVNKINLFPPKTRELLRIYQAGMGIEAMGFITPLLSIVSFLLVQAKLKISEKNIEQPINIWSMVVAYPGCKKTPLFSLFMSNLDRFAPGCKRDLFPENLYDSMWGGELVRL